MLRGAAASAIACVAEHGVAFEQSAVSEAAGAAYRTSASAVHVPAVRSQTPLSQSSSLVHARHWCVMASHVGVSPEHWDESMQPTHVPSEAQCGVPPLQSPSV